MFPNVPTEGNAEIKWLKKYKKSAKSFDFTDFPGAAGQIRTADLILTKDALYLLSYSSKDDAP